MACRFRRECPRIPGRGWYVCPAQKDETFASCCAELARAAPSLAAGKRIEAECCRRCANADALVPSKKHNDLLLRLVPCSTAAVQPFLPSLPYRLPEPEAEDASDVTPKSNYTADPDLQSEVDRLRVENDELRATNFQLQTGNAQMLRVSMGGSDACLTSELPVDVFDDPFEPPLGSTSWIMQRSSASSCRSSNADNETVWGMASSSSDWQSECTSLCASGRMTPVQHAFVPQPGCAMVSAWFPFVPTTSNGVFDVSVIPRGIVQSAREQFERIAG